MLKISQSMAIAAFVLGGVSLHANATDNSAYCAFYNQPNSYGYGLCMGGPGGTIPTTPAPTCTRYHYVTEYAITASCQALSEPAKTNCLNAAQMSGQPHQVKVCDN